MKLHVLRFLLLLCSISVHAETPSDASLDQLLDLTHQREQILSSYSGVSEAYANAMLTAAVRNPRLTDKQREMLGDIKVRATAITSRLVKWEIVRPMLLEQYRNKMSQHQVDQVLEMLRSPAWKILTDLVTPVQVEAITGTIQVATRMYPQIEAEVNRTVSEALALEKSKL